jgi:hypothetical protein
VPITKITLLRCQTEPSRDRKGVTMGLLAHQR